MVSKGSAKVTSFGWNDSQMTVEANGDDGGLGSLKLTLELAWFNCSWIKIEYLIAGQDDF